MSRAGRIAHALSPRGLVAAAGLVFAWCALWGEVSAANLLSGVVVVGAVGVLRLGARPEGRIRLVPLIRFVGAVAVDLVVSTGAVAREILTPTDFTEEAIVAVDVPPGARRHVLLLVVVITLTPGTAVVDVDPDSGTLYLHLLHCDRRETTTRHISRLAELTCAALPDPSPPSEAHP